MLLIEAYTLETYVFQFVFSHSETLNSYGALELTCMSCRELLSDLMPSDMRLAHAMRAAGAFKEKF